jgi:hypothetical protein
MDEPSLLPEGIEIAKFRPHVHRDPDFLGSLTYLETNCSVTEVQEPGSNIVLLRDNATGKIAGVRIENFSYIPEL